MSKLRVGGDGILISPCQGAHGAHGAHGAQENKFLQSGSEADSEEADSDIY